MKTLIIGLLLCAGVYAQSELADTIVYTPRQEIGFRLFKALEVAMTYLNESPFTTLEYMSPADQLRKRADQMEQKDRDIIYLLNLIEEARGIYRKNPYEFSPTER